MVVMAAVTTTREQEGGSDRVDLSVDSLDVPPSGSAAAATSALANHDRAGDGDAVNEKVIKVELATVSAAANKSDLDIDEEELQVDDEVEVKKPSSNAWAAKKTVAQGMMDIALITSNANQLRYLIMYGKHSATYYVSISLIVISLFLQVAVGVTLIFKGRHDLKGEEKRAHANRLNNYVVVGVFLVTLINVFAASFSDVTVAPGAPATTAPPAS